MNQSKSFDAIINEIFIKIYDIATQFENDLDIDIDTLIENEGILIKNKIEFNNILKILANKRLITGEYVIGSPFFETIRITPYGMKKYLERKYSRETISRVNEKINHFAKNRGSLSAKDISDYSGISAFEAALIFRRE